jgi:hypothetical protein
MGLPRLSRVLADSSAPQQQTPIDIKEPRRSLTPAACADLVACQLAPLASLIRPCRNALACSAVPSNHPPPTHGPSPRGRRRCGAGAELLAAAALALASSCATCASNCARVSKFSARMRTSITRDEMLYNAVWAPVRAAVSAWATHVSNTNMIRARCSQTSSRNSMGPGGSGCSGAPPRSAGELAITACAAGWHRGREVVTPAPPVSLRLSPHPCVPLPPQRHHSQKVMLYQSASEHQTVGALTRQRALLER